MSHVVKTVAEIHPEPRYPVIAEELEGINLTQSDPDFMRGIDDAFSGTESLDEVLCDYLEPLSHSSTFDHRVPTSPLNTVVIEDSDVSPIVVEPRAVLGGVGATGTGPTHVASPFRGRVIGAPIKTKQRRRKSSIAKTLFTVPPTTSCSPSGSNLESNPRRKRTLPREFNELGSGADGSVPQNPQGPHPAAFCTSTSCTPDPQDLLPKLKRFNWRQYTHSVDQMTRSVQLLASVVSDYIACVSAPWKKN